MENPPKPEFDIRAEYQSLTEKAFKFTLYRIPILIGIILVFLNGIQSPQFDRIQSDFRQVKKLKDTSWGVPYHRNWYVNDLFQDHGIYDHDSIASLRSAYDNEIRVADGYKEEDSIFNLTPYFFNSEALPIGEPRTPNYQKQWVRIKKQYDQLISEVPGFKKGLLGNWFTDFERHYMEETVPDSLLWVESARTTGAEIALRRHPADSAKLFSKISDQYVSLVKKRKLTSALARDGDGDNPVKDKLTAILISQDTSAMHTARRQQEQLLDTVQAHLTSILNLKLPFLSESPIDLEYWSFLMPVIMVIFFIYLYSLNTRIALLEKMSGEISVSDSPDELLHGTGLVSYHKQPQMISRYVFSVIEMILWGIFVLLFCYIIDKIGGFVRDIFAGSVVIIYFTLVYLMINEAKLRQSMLKRPNPIILIGLWNRFWLAITNAITYKRRGRYISRGNILILSSLLFAISTRMSSCRVHPGVIYSTPDNKPISGGDLLKKVNADSELNGWQMITGFKRTVWDFGTGGIGPNRFFQWCYILLILLVLAYLAIALIGRWRKPRPDYPVIKHYFLILLCLLFIEYNVYLSKIFTELWVGVFMLSLISISWLMINRKDILSRERIPYGKMAESLLLTTLPFILFAAWDYREVALKPWKLFDGRIMIQWGLAWLIAGLFVSLKGEKIALEGEGSISHYRPYPLLERILADSRVALMASPKFVWYTLLLLAVSYFIGPFLVYFYQLVFTHNRVSFLEPITELFGFSFIAVMGITSFLIFWLSISLLMTRRYSCLIRKLGIFVIGSILIVLDFLIVYVVKEPLIAALPYIIALGIATWLIRLPVKGVTGSGVLVEHVVR